MTLVDKYYELVGAYHQLRSKKFVGSKVEKIKHEYDWGADTSCFTLLIRIPKVNGDYTEMALRDGHVAGTVRRAASLIRMHGRSVVRYKATGTVIVRSVPYTYSGEMVTISVGVGSKTDIECVEIPIEWATSDDDCDKMGVMRLLITYMRRAFECEMSHFENIETDGPSCYSGISDSGEENTIDE